MEMDQAIHPTYPTNSLNFLHRLRGETINYDGTAQSADSTPPDQNAHTNPKSSICPEASKPTKPLRLNILIIGAGLGGLATSIALSQSPSQHSITILESAPQLAEVGAGIQIPPNSLRLLLQWGISPHLAAKAVEPTGITLRRWEDGRAIGYTALLPQHREKYRAPYWVVHRADLHAAMVALAREGGVQIQTGCHVVEYDEAAPSVRLADGRILTADLVVAADGVKSIARGRIPGLRDIWPQTTPFAAYRATVDVERMRSDPDTAWLVPDGMPSLNLWIGEGRHVMSYTIKGGSEFNMVLSHRDSSDPAKWPADPRERLAQMRGYYEDWDSRLVKVLGMVEKTMKWPLMTVPTSERWVGDEGRLVILGDAAHGMLPYMSQGAAMAVEDGAALAEVLGFVTEREQMVKALEAWERVRVRRARSMQQASELNGLLWHFGDGREQAARDQSMRLELEGGAVRESANQWTDPVTADWAYGYDAVKEIRREMVGWDGEKEGLRL